MTPLFADGDFLSELAAMITAVAGLIVAIVACRKLFKEQIKRTEAETGKETAEAKQEEAQVKQAEEYKYRLEAERREAAEHKQRLEAEKAVGQLETILVQMTKLNEPNGEPMDDKIFAIVNGLIVKVDTLTKAINQLRQDDDELKKRGVRPPLRTGGFPTRKGDTVFYRGEPFKFVQWGGVNSRIETIDRSVSPLLPNKSNTDTCPINELFQDIEGPQRIFKS